MARAWGWLALVAALLAAGCGSGGKAPSRNLTLSIAAPPVAVAVGELVSLQVSATDAQGAPALLAPGSVTWTSSRPNVVSVDADGRVSARAGGVAVISASTSDARGPAAVTVSAVRDPRDQPLLRWSRGSTITLPAGMSFGCTVWDPVAGRWRGYYQQVRSDGNDVIYMSASADGVAWTAGAVALGAGVEGSWDGGTVGIPFVWREDGAARPWRMMYRGKIGKTGGGYEVGLATSLDGVVWERRDTLGNPVAAPVFRAGDYGAWDHAALDFGSVIKVGGTYYLYYDTIGMPHREVGLATSTDLVKWTRDPANPLYRGTESADLPNASQNPLNGRFCPDIVRWDRDDGSTRYVMLVPTYEPGQTTSRLEVYTCSTPVFRRDDRAYVGTVAMDGNGEAAKFDTPRIFCESVDRNVTQPGITGAVVRAWVAVVRVNPKTGGAAWTTETITHDRSARMAPRASAMSGTARP